jgi:hypothetical protein
MLVSSQDRFEAENCEEDCSCMRVQLAAHDLVELFAKRSFRCDCGTLSLGRGKQDKEASIHPCNLRGKDLVYAPQNDDNVYSKNFEGAFCRCERGKTYNAELEEEVSVRHQDSWQRNLILSLFSRCCRRCFSACAAKIGCTSHVPLCDRAKRSTISIRQVEN